MTKELKIRWPEYYVRDMSRYIYSINTWYFDVFNVIVKIRFDSSPNYLKFRE